MENKKLTVAEAARIKGVDVDTVYAAIHKDKLPHIVETRPKYFVMSDDLEAWTPGTYAGVQREKVRRGPGRPKKESKDADIS